MKNTSTIKLIGALIVIVAIVWAIVYFSHSGTNAPVTSTATSTPAMATSTDATASSTVSAADISFIYKVTTAKTAYKQNEQFDIYVSVMNNTNENKNFNFANGCEGDYKIGSFDLKDHIRCTPDATFFTVPAHEEKVVKLVHYPTVYQIPPGKYTLTATIVGYGGSSVPITITK